MKCFFHEEEDARCICRRCGKAMCISCSSIGQHRGYCPSCMLSVYQSKRLRAILTLIMILIVSLLLYFLDIWKFLLQAKNLTWFILIVAILLGIFAWACCVISNCSSIIRMVKNALRQGKNNHSH